MQGFPGTTSVKFSVDVNGWPTKWRRKLQKFQPAKSGARTLQTDIDRRKTDGQAIAYSERDCEFTFAKMTTIDGHLYLLCTRCVEMGGFFMRSGAT